MWNTHHVVSCLAFALLLFVRWPRLQAVVLLSLGQASGSREQVKAAQQLFQVVGSSPSECDTIPGRQAMASCFFLLKQYDDVLVFLNVSVWRLLCLCNVGTCAAQCTRGHHLGLLV